MKMVVGYGIERLEHTNMKLTNKLPHNNLVVGLPKIKFEKNIICGACQMTKQTKTSFNSKISYFNF